jgi:hypothetical protein
MKPQNIDYKNFINKKRLITILRMFLSFIKNSISFVIHYKLKFKEYGNF